MNHVRLGNTGLKVSRLCLGTMTFGKQCDEATSIKIMDRAADAGITFFDTADAYPLGAFTPARFLAGSPSAGSGAPTVRTEEIIGRWMKGRRDDFIIATKGFTPMGPQPFQRGNSRRHLTNAAEASLRRLGTDYIDLYLVHGPDPETPVDETLEALTALVAAGKIRYVGCSNHLAYQIARAIGRSEARGLVKYVVTQPRYNLLFREIERELLPLCIEEGVGVMTYNPLAGGMLSGKHDRSKAPTAGTRFAFEGFAGNMYRERYWKEQTFNAVETLQNIASEASLELPTLAVAWILAQPGITSPIIGASRPEQLDATLRAADVKLDPQLLTRLDETTREFRRGDSTR